MIGLGRRRVVTREADFVGSIGLDLVSVGAKGGVDGKGVVDSKRLVDSKGEWA
jgi:hypothetical protein